MRQPTSHNLAYNLLFSHKTSDFSHQTSSTLNPQQLPPHVTLIYIPALTRAGGF